MIDFASMLGSSRAYNLHSHTQFCDGRSSMADCAAEAARRKFTHYAFSPHSPIPVSSPCNMSADDVDPYISEVRRIAAIHAPSTRVMASMEIDFLHGLWGPADPFFDSIPLDFRIGSVHFIPHDSTFIDIDGSAERFIDNMNGPFCRDIRHVVDSFFDASEAMLQAGHFDIIGHFDKIAMNGSQFDPQLTSRPWYRSRVYDLIDLIAESGVTAEINTKALTTRGRFFPDESLWRQLLIRRIPLVVNSDAHFAHLIDANRSEAFSILDRLSSSL